MTNDGLTAWTITLGPIWIPLLAYFLGSIPFGLLIAKFGGRSDLRQSGSGNIGAANVTRVVGLGAGVLTLLLDAAKGALSVWLAAVFTHVDLVWMVVTGLAAILGHLFPIWLGFRGGRGVATGAGVFLMICPYAVLAAIALWILVVALWRYTSLGSIAASAALPLLVHWLWRPPHLPHYPPPHVVTIGVSMAAALIVWKHRQNIERLLAGTETKLTLPRRKPPL